LNLKQFHRPQHKKTCGPTVESSGINKLVQSFIANKILRGYLEVCLILSFDLLHDRSRAIDTPLTARLDVGVEPSDTTITLQMLHGADVGTNIEGMFQINTVSTYQSGKPPTETRMQMWRDTRRNIAAAGFASDPVMIVEFIKDSKNAISMAIQIREISFFIARKASPFMNLSALYGITKTPMSATTCIE
jgi:hypothetical protein